ncbi:carbohydrate kinase family protein [Christiangramia forsetii]|uniref:PfkB family carbohydrate kinase n=2 Tax=Christiangramia forsetii TaxID=411153 RepID=A0LXA8_CHRFK|nr:carbohydrate kinase [Christiangramia forsetii]GGG27716.1 fructokinase [Christiangramia forsetii]CAL65003.1 PfkB family carbohydrate kinase [Christiangramia forsetii KT0803]
MTKKIKAVCFGEILYDVFPDMERIGGAPLNVASRLSSMGIDTEMISKVGVDDKGNELLSYLSSRNIETGNILKDEDHPTGMVKVNLSDGGSATYDITYPSAWDKIELTKTMENSVENSDAFIFGSLVCRDEVSRKTLFELIPKATYRVLDFNLRPPHYSKGLILELIQHAEFIKFNDDELFEIADLMGSPYNSLEQNLLFMAVKSNAETICVTKGRHGAVLMHDKKLYYNSGYKVKVKDTVGAGDSFLGTLLAKLLQEEKPQQALDMACAVGALVAAKEGANPELSNELINTFINPV